MDNSEKDRRGKLVAEHSDGIHPPYEIFYLMSVWETAARTLDAFERYDALLAEGARDLAIVATLQEALTHVAALARFFWPIRDKWNTYSRGSKLRKAFGVEDDSCLRDKQLRNCLEHYDEKVDEFLLEDRAGNFYPQSIVGPSAMSENAIIHVFRLVDPKEQVFVLLGNKYNFGRIREAVEDVYANAQRMISSGGRLR